MVTTHYDIRKVLRDNGLLETLESLECIVKKKDIHTDKRWKNFVTDFSIMKHFELAKDDVNHWNHLFSVAGGGSIK